MKNGVTISSDSLTLAACSEHVHVHVHVDSLPIF